MHLIFSLALHALIGGASGYAVYFFRTKKFFQEKEDLLERIDELFCQRVELIDELDSIEEKADPRIRPKIHDVTSRIRSFL